MYESFGANYKEEHACAEKECISISHEGFKAFNMPITIYWKKGIGLKDKTFTVYHEICFEGKGKTRTYGEIAKKLGISPRYVGRACGENKHIIVIPCHRVIKSDGSMGGFSAKGGIKLKEKLLRFEESI